MKKTFRINPVIFITILLFFASDCKKVEPPTMAVLSTTAVNNITAITATSGGNISSDGSATITTRGVCWGASANPTTSDSKTADSDGIGQFVSDITGLIAGTTYHIRAYAINSVGTAYGADLSFTTLGEAPSSVTQPATNVTATEATLNGIVNPNYLSTTVTFEYGTSTDYGSTVNVTQSPLAGNTITNVNAVISGLTAETIFHFRLKTVNSLGTVYGADMVFTTLQFQLTDGLVAYYPFNGNANDESGNANNATVSGPILTTDRFGNSNKAYYLNGTSDYIIVPDASTLRPSIISVSLWVYKQSVTENSLIYKGGVNNASGEMYALNTTSWNVKVNSNCTPGTGWQLNGYTPNFVSNKWYHLVCTYDGTTSKVFLNSQKISETTFNGTIDNCPGGDLIFGRAWSGLPWYFKGKFDDIRIYNRAISEVEVQQLYQEGGYTGPEMVKDIDGNWYPYSTIGTQVWLIENLKTTRFNDGTIIYLTDDAALWKYYDSEASFTVSPKYCWMYNNEATYKKDYGALYNWGAVVSRKLCPIGWHVPTNKEWVTLFKFLLNNDSAGDQGFYNGVQSNDTFPFPFGGSRNSDGTFNAPGHNADYWSSTSYGTTEKSSEYFFESGVREDPYAFLTEGKSVRCIKDY